MSPNLLNFTVAAAVTFTTGPAVRRLMLAAGTVDLPNHRSSHTVAVPRGGGIACLLGASAGLLLPPRTVPVRDLIVIGGLAGVGFADDRSGGLDPRTRLVAQSSAGIICGLRHAPTVGLVGAVIVPGVVNVVNFMDGINGISGSTAFVWGLFAAMDPTSTGAARAIGAVTAGAGVGFLPHNVPQARLFLGDVGSYLLGGLMSIALVETLRSPASTFRLGAPLLPYAVDAAQAIWRRARCGAPLFEAHREHVYQRIVDDHDVRHMTMSAGHAIVAAVVGLTSRSSNPAVAFGGTSAILAGYVASPSALRRLHRRHG